MLVPSINDKVITIQCEPYYRKHIEYILTDLIKNHRRTLHDSITTVINDYTDSISNTECMDIIGHYGLNEAMEKWGRRCNNEYVSLTDCILTRIVNDNVYTHQYGLQWQELDVVDELHFEYV